MSTKSSGITGSLLWTFCERILAQLVSTIVTMVIARILTPEHYGIISIVNVFIALCSLFVSTGFGSAVVQKKEAVDRDFDTAFFISLATAVGVYILLFLTAPLISRFYGIPELTAATRTMGLCLPLLALNHIQHSFIQRQMAFRRLFIANLFGSILSGVLGVILALTGFGIWALVVQYLTHTAINCVVLFCIGDWRPHLRFSTATAKTIFSFGWKVMASDFVPTFSAKLRNLIIGKEFGSSDLAYYDQGNKYAEMLVDNVNVAISKVMLPVYAGFQDNLPQLKEVLRRSVRMGIFILSPILLGFLGVAENFVTVFLTEKWLPCVPYLQICAIACMFRPLETTCHKLLLAIGRGEVVVRTMIAIHTVSLAATLLAAFLWKSVLLVALGSLLATATSLICFMSSIHRLVGYKPMEQLRDILPSLVASLLMCGVVLLFGQLPIYPVVELVLQIALGGVVYVGLSMVLNRKMVLDVLGMVRRQK